MRCKEIYDTALSLIAESRDPSDTADYEERAAYLLAAFCTDNSQTDERVREYYGKPKVTYAESLYLPLDEQFPFMAKLASPAALYLAAMLVIDDFPELSDRLYDRYCDSMSKLCNTLSSKSGKIVNKYFGM